LGEDKAGALTLRPDKKGGDEIALSALSLALNAHDIHLAE
jgi:hypothetical protein